MMKEKNDKRKLKADIKQKVVPIPLVISQLYDNNSNEIDDDSARDKIKKMKPKMTSEVVLPYSRYLRVEQSDEIEEEEAIDTRKLSSKKEVPKNWLKDYELYDEAEEELQSEYGTADPDYPITDVQCGGCGALLHCKR
jgi:hypothetical protein